MKIAITADVGEAPKFIREANLMTYSGRFLDSSFTFILFIDPDLVNQIVKRDNVIVVPYKAASDEYYDKYPYAKSLEFVHSNKDILKAYDYLIKTDTDVFFTPSLNNHIFDNNLYFGKNSYLAGAALTDLARNSFGFENFEHIQSLNSTIIGPTQDVIDLMEASDYLCKFLYAKLVPKGTNHYDQLNKWGTESLYPGISTLYATEIIANSYFKDRVVPTDLLDSDSSDVNKKYTDVYHVHCWHTDNIFSKFKAELGEYINAQPMIGKSIAAYCLNTYLEQK
jgi:hypothetical protein